jgi:hypothetical protein
VAVAIIVGGVKVGEAIKATFLTAVAVAVVLAPLQFLYWQALGMFG